MCKEVDRIEVINSAVDFNYNLICMESKVRSSKEIFIFEKKIVSTTHLLESNRTLFFSARDVFLRNKLYKYSNLFSVAICEPILCRLYLWYNVKKGIFDHIIRDDIYIEGISVNACLPGCPSQCKYQAEKRQVTQEKMLCP